MKYVHTYIHISKSGDRAGTSILHLTFLSILLNRK